MWNKDFQENKIEAVTRENVTLGKTIMILVWTHIILVPTLVYTNLLIVSIQHLYVS